MAVGLGEADRLEGDRTRDGPAGGGVRLGTAAMSIRV